MVRSAHILPKKSIDIIYLFFKIKDKILDKRVDLRNKEILDSWKAISEHLDRDIRTCFRWEKELGLPVHRIDKDSPRSKVFAYKSEIDKWLRARADSIELKRKSLSKKNLAVFGLGTALVLSLMFSAYLYLSYRKLSSHLSEEISLAVVPFESLKSSSADEYFPEGITNEIINVLTTSSQIKIVHPSRVADSDIFSKSLKRVGKELDVDYILKAKLKSVEEKKEIEVYVQLIQTKTEQEIWSNTYKAKIGDPLTISADISQRLFELLNLKKEQDFFLSSGLSRSKDHPELNYLREKYILPELLKDSNDPWKLYWQGKFYWGKGTQDCNNLAISLLKKAIEIDNNFALAYIGLARCYVNNVNFGWDFDLKWLNKADELIKKAQEISPDLPEYYATLIQVYLLKETAFNEKKGEFIPHLIQEGIKRHPYHSQLNSIIGAYYFLKFGKEGNKEDFEKALEYKEKSFWPDPTRLNNFVYAELLMLNSEFYKAIEICNNIEKYDFSFSTKSRLGEIYYYLGDLHTSEEIYRQFGTAPLRFKIDSMFFLAMIAAQNGDKEKALRLVNEIDLLYPQETILNDYLKLASVYLGLQMRELGYEKLKSFFSRPMIKKMRFIFQKYIYLDKNFDNYREDEEFQKIINMEETNG